MVRAASVQLNLGAELVGSYINAILYSLEMVCVYLYYKTKRSRRDALFVKAAVGTNAVIDTVGTWGVCASYFYFSVTGWGSYDRALRSHWTEDVWFISTAFSSFVVQTFMVRRYFILSRKYAIATFIIALMLLSLGAHLFLGISSSLNLESRTLNNRLDDYKPVILSLSSTAAADIAITLALLWKLKTTHTYSRITHNLLRRVSVIAIITGSASAAVALATLISFLAYPLASLSTCFSFFLGRVYSLTMLFTLLYRDMMTGDAWIQIDVTKEEEESHRGSSNTHEDQQNDSTPSSEMTFAHHDSLSQSQPASGSREERYENIQRSDSGGTIAWTRTTKVGPSDASEEC